ncbi:AzlD domain-containing protein [Pokkaliibacter sp. MBI-7]|uniref:AzlD domain-containing protein n=1 Tax=Pokkaliibacter sp. MBI-7 TaxID=3040600 RepID=UPI00244AB188|nr:AzlD domain-containing protein [Pokkaliibacter sp. MBI-7]MDH2433309.1 AzlD domain-containing protein [Pokkaliibacter sp. MBI-7]
MNDLTLLWLILAMMAVTFVPRYLPFALAHRFQLPPLLQRTLGYVPVAVLTAIVVQTTLVRDQQIHTDWQNPTLWAAVVAGLMAWRGVSLLLTVCGGMLVYGVLRWLF